MSCQKLRPQSSSSCWASMFRRNSSPVNTSTPIAISRTPGDAVDHGVVAADPAERGGRARERDRGEEERHGEPERVHGQQAAALRRPSPASRPARGSRRAPGPRTASMRSRTRRRRPAARRCRRAARARRPAIRGSASARTARAGKTPIAMIAIPATFSSVWRLSDSVLPIPVAVMPSRMKIALKVRMNRPDRDHHRRAAARPRVARSSPGVRPQTVDR